MNREDNRLQVFFDGKPDADTRGRAEKQRLSLGSQRGRMAEAAHGQRHPGG